MGKFLLIAIFVMGHISAYAKSRLEDSATQAIYGQDNRSYATTLQMRLMSVSNATAALIPAQNIVSAWGNLIYSIPKMTLQKKSKVCSDERFANDPVAAVCTGFLVGPDLLVTAGHCIRNEYECENARFVFNFQNDVITEIDNKIYIAAANVYSCKSIIHREYQGGSNSGRLDYALISLDRPVSGRKPLAFRKEGIIPDYTKLAIVGHPSGLPLMIADDAKVRKNTEEFYFTTNLDSFGGNSGAPVINLTTGLVEGLLVRGETDYVWDEKSKCNRPVTCSEENCKGEDVTRITAIPELM